MPRVDAEETLKPPFPYFGGKARAVGIVWPRFGEVRNYVEPFCGSLAMLLGRPDPSGVETVNDADGLIANFWRATQHDPEAVAEHADNPVNENDLHARHAWLVGVKDSLQARLEGDPDYYDAKVAGWWVWGLSCWIGAGFCSGKGPWHVVDGSLVNAGDAGRGVNRQLPHLGNAGRGVNRQRDGLIDYFGEIRDRIRSVRVCCGDWSRVCGDAVLFPVAKNGPTAVFLDPPYADTAKRDSSLYRMECLSVAHDVRRWAIERGDDPRLRIALCGYEGEHEMPASWECVEGKAGGGHGYGGQSKAGYTNARRERIWFSPHCVKPMKSAQAPLFDWT